MPEIKYQRSCLRWPGNKFLLLSEIVPLTTKVLFKNYHEPFLGSGSVFLNIEGQEQSFLSDSNSALINFYRQVKNNLPELIQQINKKENTEEFFYAERSRDYKNEVQKAAQFYFLNRTCFNGIYRVNSKGKFNVPYGRRKNLVIVDEINLLILKDKLQNVELANEDFLQSAKKIKTGDLVYFDPPYSPKKNGKSFLMYNEILFNWDDQLELQALCQELISKDVKIILSNLFNEEVYELFSNQLGMHSKIIERFSLVGANQKSRGLIREYVFTSFNMNGEL